MIETFEQVIEIMGAAIGTIIVISNVLISFLTLISSYNIEIGLMTKKEQWKFMITNLTLLAFSIWLLNVVFCFVFKDEKYINLLLICSMIAIFVWLITGIILGCQLWNKRKKISLQSKKEKNTRMVCLLAFFVLEITLNCCLAYVSIEKYYVWFGSFIMTVLVMEMLVWMFDLKNLSGTSKIRYYDSELKKDIFIFFRYNQNCYMCGNTSKLNECTENYLIPYERIQEAKLMPLLKKDLCVNCQRVMIQTPNGEYELEKVLEKVKEKMQDQNITQNKFNETHIYIKPLEKKVFYVTPDEVVDVVEL